MRGRADIDYRGRALQMLQRALAADPKGPLFRTIGRGAAEPTATRLPQSNAYAMIGRPAAAAGITASLKDGGTLERVGLAARHDQPWHTLSGGERQRVHVARALAQEPRELILDEPTNHLDIQHQLAILTLVRRLGLTCVVALHDLNLASLFCDRVGVLAGGRLVAFGTPQEVLTPRLIAEVFGVEVVIRESAGGRRHIEYVVEHEAGDHA